MQRPHRHFIESRTFWRLVLFILILLLGAGVLHAPGPTQVVAPHDRPLVNPRD